MTAYSFFRTALLSSFVSVVLTCCSNEKTETPLQIKNIAATEAATRAKAIESSVSPQLAEGLTLSIWAIDSLVADPVSIDMDDKGRLYYTRTNRQKNSEFDIRGHNDWEIASIS